MALIDYFVILWPMKHLIVIILALLPLAVSADEALQQRLDSVIALRRHYMDVKEQHIRQLTLRLEKAPAPEKLTLATRLYREYYTYRFDSAMHYARLEAAIAHGLGNIRAERIAGIHLAMLYAIGGYYSEGERQLLSIPVDDNDQEFAFEYYITGYWVYNYWSGYCNDKIFSPEYDRKKIAYLKRALPLCPDKQSAVYQYLLGEMAFWQKEPARVSSAYYRHAVDKARINTRTYASAAYGIARNYLSEGNTEQYENWIIRAAISDQVNPLKENLALQEYAMYLFNKDEKNAEKSTHYIYCSMEDAQFYNNRLRMLEISRRLPAIVAVYQQQVDAKRRSVTSLSIALGFFIALLLVGSGYIMKQSGRLHRRGTEIDRQNKELEKLNALLRKTDETRGRYMRLFMDLCAIYIGKMNDYRKLVVRKVKAHQVDDLLRSANSTKLSEQESAQFYTQFDKAFLELYPNFVDDFNALLRPDSRLSLTRDGSLTTEMRIYALVRLGVGESVEIATLLFYSPQTIYNYRTATRKRAIHPETFEDDVRALR